MTKAICVIFLSILVSACSGGSGGGNNNQTGGGGNVNQNGAVLADRANGIWGGTLSENGVGTFQLLALLHEGDFLAINIEANVMYAGIYNLNGNDLAGQVTVYQLDGGVLGTAQLDGVVTELSQIAITYNSSDGGTGSISLFYDDLYERDSSLATIAGNYSYSIQQVGYTLDVAIQSDGSLSGSDPEGCQLMGNVLMLNPNFNLYGINLTLSSCGTNNGSYSGYAGLGDYIGISDILTVAVANPDFVYVAQLLRKE